MTAAERCPHRVVYGDVATAGRRAKPFILEDRGQSLPGGVVQKCIGSQGILTADLGG
jgi:hypothetical protein